MAEAVCEAGNHGFTAAGTERDGGIPGGIGGGPDHPAQTLFYVGVPDVESSLQEAERLGGARVSGPLRSPSSPLVVGFSIDPEGQLNEFFFILDGRFHIELGGPDSDLGAVVLGFRQGCSVPAGLLHRPVVRSAVLMIERAGVVATGD